MSDESHRESAISLFSRGFFSVMSFNMPDIFRIGEVKKDRAPRRERRGVGRHFAKVGGMLSDAYDSGMASAGIKK